jgi:predicted dinucleotide-binding enzyme
MYYETLRTEGRPDAPLEERLTLYLAGDDPEARATVAELIEVVGFAPLEVGSLAEGRLMEPGSAIYNEPMTLPEAREALAALRE